MGIVSDRSVGHISRWVGLVLAVGTVPKLDFRLIRQGESSRNVDPDEKCIALALGGTESTG